MASAEKVSADGAGVRAPGPRPAAVGLTTDRAVALLIVALLVALVVIRRGFSGALGD